MISFKDTLFQVLEITNQLIENEDSNKIYEIIAKNTQCYFDINSKTLYPPFVFAIIDEHFYSMDKNSQQEELSEFNLLFDNICQELILDKRIIKTQSGFSFNDEEEINQLKFCHFLFQGKCILSIKQCYRNDFYNYVITPIIIISNQL